jgi:hypothetical protein
MRLPPGVTSKDFSEAIKQFEEAVGKEWVFTSDEDVALYRDAYSPFYGEPDELVASAAVAPDGVEQVQKVVKIANSYKIPIYPISTGKDLGYGGSAPVLSGSVVLDLKRMNRILEVNEKNAYALVEPGVSYFDLYRYIQEKGIKLWVDVPDPGWGSPVGNSLDRGGGYLMAEYRNHFDSHCGMEIVLANGEIIRTGMGAMPGAKTWQEYKTGFGPWVDGIFSQSNFGVVTKMGFWLMPEPYAYLSGTVYVPRHDDLIPLVDILTYLENTRVTNGMPDLGSPLLHIPMISEIATWNEGGGPPPPEPELAALLAKPDAEASPELQEYALRKGIGFWSCKLSFYGAAKANEANWEFAKEKFSTIPGAKFVENESYSARRSTSPSSAYRAWRCFPSARGRPSIQRPRAGTCGFRPSSRGRAKRFSKRIACLQKRLGNLGFPCCPLAFLRPIGRERSSIFLLFPLRATPRRTSETARHSRSWWRGRRSMAGENIAPPRPFRTSS